MSATKVQAPSNAGTAPDIHADKMPAEVRKAEVTRLNSVARELRDEGKHLEAIGLLQKAKELTPDAKTRQGLLMAYVEYGFELLRVEKARPV